MCSSSHRTVIRVTRVVGHVWLTLPSSDSHFRPDGGSSLSPLPLLPPLRNNNSQGRKAGQRFRLHHFPLMTGEPTSISLLPYCTLHNKDRALAFSLVGSSKHTVLSAFIPSLTNRCSQQKRRIRPKTVAFPLTTTATPQAFRGAPSLLFRLLSLLLVHPLPLHSTASL